MAPLLPALVALCAPKASLSGSFPVTSVASIVVEASRWFRFSKGVAPSSYVNLCSAQ